MKEPESTMVIFFRNNPVVVRSVLYVTLSGRVEQKVDAESENRDPATDGCRIRWYPIGSGNDLMDIENGSSEPEPELSFDELIIFFPPKLWITFSKTFQVKFFFLLVNSIIFHLQSFRVAAARFHSILLLLLLLLLWEHQGVVFCQRSKSTRADVWTFPNWSLSLFGRISLGCLCWLIIRDDALISHTLKIPKIIWLFFHLPQSIMSSDMLGTFHANS